jgi:hypothetical protein
MSTRTLIRRLLTPIEMTSILSGNLTPQIYTAGQERKRTLKTLLTLTLFCVGLGCSVTVFVTQAHRQNVPTVVLQASERVLEEVPSITGITWSSKDDLLYGVSGTSPGLYAYEPKSRTAKQVGALNLNGGSVAAAISGDVYVSAGASGVHALNQTKPTVKRVATRSWHSLALLADESIVVSPSDDNSLFSIFKSPGGPVKRIGQKKEFVVKGTSQNEFFNQGVVAVNEVDNTIYYVFTHALVPTVQHFNKEGELLAEFQVEGAAIDLQVGLTKQILRAKAGENCARGFTVITSATVDSTTGHLWLGMNGSSKQGTVYEYSPEGVKLKEYAFLLKQPSNLGNIITGINGLVVRAPFIYVLTSQGTVYKFNQEDDVSAELRALRADLKEEQAKTPRITRMVKYVRSFWTSAPSALASLQLPCPQEQPLTCQVNCKPDTSPASRNCGADAKSILPSGDIAIGQTACNNTGTGAFGQPSCVISYNVCRSTNNGDRYSTTYTSVCNPPACVSPKVNNPETGVCQCPAERPTCLNNQTYSETTCNCENNPPDDGGGYGGTSCQNFSEFEDCIRQEVYRWNESTCRCECDARTGIGCGSPILIDVDGNGFSLTSVNSGVLFDLNNDGVRERIAWTAPGSDEAFLVLDRNGNATIDNGSELFGNFTPQPAPPPHIFRNGFLALAEYDKPQNGGNGDGLIDKNDTIFASLHLWQDSNHNGVSESSELHALSDLHIYSISLDFKESWRTDQYGNKFRYRAKVNATRWAWDVFFVTP